MRIIFVCAMWMTGFDVPNLSTLYLDKPLKNHTLMQTIARANRVADEGKKNGLIVDYIGVFKNIERALALYAASGVDEDEIIRSKDELITDLKNTLRTMKEFLSAEQIELKPLIEAPAEQKLLRTLRQIYGSLLLNGPFSIVIARHGEMIGLTDRIRLRPLVVGEKGSMLYLSSEESAIRLVCPDLDDAWIPAGGEPVIGRLQQAKSKEFALAGGVM